MAGKLVDHKLDLIIGTDVVYWRSQIEPLLNTLDELNEKNGNIPCYICYIERHKNTHTEFLEGLATHGYTVVEVGT